MSIIERGKQQLVESRGKNLKSKGNLVWKAQQEIRDTFVNRFYRNTLNNYRMTDESPDPEITPDRELGNRYDDSNVQWFFTYEGIEWKAKWTQRTYYGSGPVLQFWIKAKRKGIIKHKLGSVWYRVTSPADVAEILGVPSPSESTLS